MFLIILNLGLVLIFEFFETTLRQKIKRATGRSYVHVYIFSVKFVCKSVTIKFWLINNYPERNFTGLITMYERKSGLVLFNYKLST